MSTQTLFNSVERESQAQVNDTEQLLTSLKEARATCAEELKSAINVTRQYVATLDALESKDPGFDPALFLLDSELKKMWQEREIIRSQYQLQLTELQSRAKQLEWQRSVVDAEQAEQATLERQAQDLENNINEAETIKRQFEGQRQSLDAMKKSLQERSFIEQDIQSLNAQRNATKDELDKVRGRFMEIQHQLHSLQDHQAQLEKNTKDKQAVLEKYESSSMQSQMALDELYAQLSLSESERNAILAKEQDLREQIKKSEDLLASYSKEWQTLTEEKQRIEQQMAGLQESLAYEEEAIRLNRQQIEVDNMAQLNALLDRVQMLSKRIDTMAQTVIQGRKQVEDFQSGYLRDNERKAGVDKELQQLRAEERVFERQTEQAEQRLSELQGRYETLYSRLEAIAKPECDFATLQSELQKLNDQISASDKTLTDLKAVLVAKRDRLRELGSSSRSQPSLSSELDAIKAQLQSMEAKRAAGIDRVNASLREKLNQFLQNALQREAQAALRLKAAEELEKKQHELLREMKGLSRLHIKTTEETQGKTPVLMDQEATSVLLESHRKKGQDEGTLINEVMDHCSQYY